MFSIGSRIKLVQGLNWFKRSIGSIVSFGSMIELVQGIDWFKGSIDSMVKLDKVLNWFKCCISSRIVICLSL